MQCSLVNGSLFSVVVCLVVQTTVGTDDVRLKLTTEQELPATEDLSLEYAVEEEVSEETEVGNVFIDIRRRYQNVFVDLQEATSRRFGDLQAIAFQRRFDDLPATEATAEFGDLPAVEDPRALNSLAAHQRGSTDLGLHALRFSILTLKSRRGGEFFTINSKTGLVETSKRIDREQLCAKLELCVLGLDVAIQRHRDDATDFQLVKVKVKVLDVNDHAPTFSKSLSKHVLSESTTPGTTFTIGSLIDSDATPYDVRNYELHPSTSPFNLAVHTRTDGGLDIKLVLVDALDFERETKYQLIVTAVDGGLPPRSGSMTLVVQVTDANDNSPRFARSCYETMVREDVPVGTVLVRARATDKDSGINGRVTYRFSNRTLNEDPESYRLFGVQRLSGRVYVREPLDFEKRSVFQLHVVAVDGGREPLTDDATVTVNIDDVNDNSPVIRVNAHNNDGHPRVSQILFNHITFNSLLGKSAVQCRFRL